MSEQITKPESKESPLQRALDIISLLIASGSKPPTWRGKCPMRKDCPHVCQDK